MGKIGRVNCDQSEFTVRFDVAPNLTPLRGSSTRKMRQQRRSIFFRSKVSYRESKKAFSAVTIQGDCSIIDTDDAQRVRVEYPHRNGVRLKKKSKRLFTAFQLSDVDAHSDTAAPGATSFLDFDPLSIRQHLLMLIPFPSVSEHAGLQPLFFAADRVVVKATREPLAENL